MDTYGFKVLSSQQDYQLAFSVMRELRPHISDESTFIEQVQRQQQQGYCLLAAWDDGQVKGLAGYRIQENFIYGRFLYIDDLVITDSERSQGLGQQFIKLLREEAQQQKCTYFVLDTGLGNTLGQRFYFRQGLLAKGLHFNQPL
ncbi:GNAT family N-acetyltransferase [Pectobacterium polonicum]|uniref:GNAT family N-acetyltransferase n=1 Tax=Pectobacterium polonicum TaxID=2485124 RepID=A0AAE9T3X8_9GAMM|nr:GNAT family N-acetyltransferase [Pectobacterium polonicum]UVO09849.1 GNAT family N-acetyltransferase [Pectobacterium polonicum]GKW26119.1 N-acetyltransferase GCN5 [Pectobacterium carotovorum subsp. carotovorum]